MVVLDPLEVIIENFPSVESLKIEVPNFPSKPTLGTHTVTLASKIFIEKSDFMEVCLFYSYLVLIIY